MCDILGRLRRWLFGAELEKYRPPDYFEEAQKWNLGQAKLDYTAEQRVPLSTLSKEGINNLDELDTMVYRLLYPVSPWHDDVHIMD